VSALKRSDSIVFSVERRLSVMSRKIMACPTGSAWLFASLSGVRRSIKSGTM
jgi:hypothetical protein